MSLFSLSEPHNCFSHNLLAVAVLANGPIKVFNKTVGAVFLIYRLDALPDD